MERVAGIGGFFFRANDPDGLGRWYEEVLGVTRPPLSFDQPVWEPDAGPTVWGAFEAGTTEFGRPEQMWMINFRVHDLGAMADQLRRAGVEVVIDPERYPNGRFARLGDPEGNPIQLWQPMIPVDE